MQPSSPPASYELLEPQIAIHIIPLHRVDTLLQNLEVVIETRACSWQGRSGRLERTY